MGPTRGTDLAPDLDAEDGAEPEDANERPRSRGRPRRRGLWRLADDLTTGGAEVVFLSLPALAGITRTSYEPASVTFATLVAVAVLGSGVGLAGGRWVVFDPPWPEWRVSTVLFRIGHYSLSVLVLGFGGGYLHATFGSTPLTVGALAAGGGLAVATLPRTLALTRRTVAWLAGWRRALFGSVPPAG